MCVCVCACVCVWGGGGGAVKLSFLVLVGGETLIYPAVLNRTESCCVVPPRMGHAFTRRRDPIEIFWRQRYQKLMLKTQLTEDELEDLIQEWQWLRVTHLTDASMEKTHLYWIWVGVRFYRGWKVL